MSSPESSAAFELPVVSEVEKTTLEVVEAPQETEEKAERAPFTMETAVAALDDVKANEEHVKPNKRIARLAKQFAADGLLVVPAGKPYHLSMEAAEGVEGSQELVNKVLMTRAAFVAEPEAPKAKSASAPKKQAKKRAPKKRPDVSLEEIGLQALEAIENVTMSADLEKAAYALHKVGLIMKINTGRYEWKVEPIEGAEFSAELAELINKKNKELTVGSLRHQAFKALKKLR